MGMRGWLGIRLGVGSVATISVCAVLAACSKHAGGVSTGAADTVSRVLAAAPEAAVVAPPADTASADLSHLHAALPAAAPEPPRPTQTTGPVSAPKLDASLGYREAPAPLRRAVTREQAVSQFCFQEFGQKVDPTLQGGIAVLVTIASGAIADAHVASARWSDRPPGEQVDRCLDERVAQAWRFAPEDSASVAPGRYVVYLTFRGS
jgi:hypothetical protein